MVPNEKAPCGACVVLFLRLLVRRLFTTPPAPFFELYFTLNFFLVFAAPVVYALAFGAGKFYKKIL